MIVGWWGIANIKILLPRKTAKDIRHLTVASIQLQQCSFLQRYAFRDWQQVDEVVFFLPTVKYLVILVDDLRLHRYLMVISIYGTVRMVESALMQ